MCGCGRTEKMGLMDRLHKFQKKEGNDRNWQSGVP